jgi:hypothetical protein
LRQDKQTSSRRSKKYHGDQSPEPRFPA